MNTVENPLSVLNYLKISDAKTIGDILHAQGNWGNPHSARVQTQKQLNALADLGKIEKCDGFYRTLDCKSEYGEHAKKLTQVLSEILKLPLTSTIYREVSFPIGHRADAVVLCQKENKGTCFILEVAHHETFEYLQRKANAYLNWKEGRQFLTNLFKVKIPHYSIATEGKEVSGAVAFSNLLTFLGGSK